VGNLFFTFRATYSTELVLDLGFIHIRCETASELDSILSRVYALVNIDQRVFIEFLVAAMKGVRRLVTILIVDECCS
jgi:hypothetical protein